MRTCGGSVCSKNLSCSGAIAKANLPSRSIPTTRSCQPSACLTAWLTGIASKNSLATMIAGPSGTSASESCQTIDTSRLPRVCFCRASSAGLVSTRCTAIARRKSGITLAARSMSSIMVPRPGPSSTRRTCGGAPIWCHTAAAHRPSSSPNIWLISGAVMKSPSLPSGSWVV